MTMSSPHGPGSGATDADGAADADDDPEAETEAETEADTAMDVVAASGRGSLC
jgi:hypothetical protein